MFFSNWKHFKSRKTMPFETNRKARFETLKTEALSRNCDTFTDLPPLICGTCENLVSFGGFETFTERENFTENDVCMCLTSN